MKKLMLACALTVSAAAGGAALLAQAPASAQPWGGSNFRGLPDGSWRDSCRDPDMRGGTLRAQCRTSYDRWVNTAINANNCRSGRIGNRDGQLVCEDSGGWYQGGWGLPGGSWRQSCRYPVMRGNFLTAQCSDTSNRWLSASVDVRSCRSGRFENGNGRLYCEGGWNRGGGNWNGGGGGWGGGYPGGSWRDTCRNVDMRGGRLSAQCRTSSGNWIGTTLDTRNCRSNRVGNSEGRLVCER